VGRNRRPLTSYERKARGSLVDSFEPEIRKQLEVCPTMPATVIAERIDWPHGITILKERIATLRPLYRLPDPCQRTSYRPGELVQFDLWQPETPIPLGSGQSDKLWVVTSVCGYSRFMAAWMVPSRAAHDVLWGMLRCFGQIGAVPKTIVWDGEGCIGQWRRGKEVFTEDFRRFKGTLGVGARLCLPNDPEAKGMNERSNGYYETSFLPGRTFLDAWDFNDQLSQWLKKANRRVHATTRTVPAEALYEDRGSMIAFPPVMPDPSLSYSMRLGRDFYVRVDCNDYSANPRFIGRMVTVRADLDTVVVTSDGLEIARHRRRYSKHQTFTDPAHSMTLRAIREEHKEQLKAPGDEVQERDLAVYDRALGVA